MTGIAGIYHFGKKAVPGNHGYKLIKALQDRPDDDAMFWQQQNVFLGWIIPKQDNNSIYHDVESQLVIAADVRIDNREELFETLKCDLRESISDIQLILLAYLEWGKSSPKYLEGDFAFMIWDEENQVMFGARDFLGNKSFFYYADFERFSFCSSMLPLLTLPYVQKHFNKSWFHINMNDSDEEEDHDDSTTPYQSIKQVPPGYAISINKDAMELSSYRTRRAISRS